MVITDLNTHAASYVSVAELAEYWDVTRQLVYKHIQSGQLPAIQLGPRCFRVPTKDAVAFERQMSSKWRKNANGGGVKVGRAPIVPLTRRQAPPPDEPVPSAAASQSLVGTLAEPLLEPKVHPTTTARPSKRVVSSPRAIPARDLRQ